MHSMLVFRIFVWSHRVLLIGPAFDTGLHVHRAAQWCYGLEGSLRVRGSRDADWQQQRFFYVPPGAPHEVESSSSTTVFLYLEPESAEFLAAQAVLRSPSTITPVVPSAAALRILPDLVSPTASIEDAGKACRALLGRPAAQATIDDSRLISSPRIARCIHEIERHLAEPIRLPALAARLRVSESWLMHQFTAELGIPIRRYVLWQRLRRALQLAMQGASLTEAAHASGFSDSAHLSRTFRSAFGVTPSMLFAHREHVVASFDSGLDQRSSCDATQDSGSRDRS